MPVENYHVAVIKDSKQYEEFRRQKDEFGDGIDVTYGIKDDTPELQAINFDAGKWSYDEAEKWIKDHNYEPIKFEKATGEAVDMFTIEPFQLQDDEGWTTILYTGKFYHDFYGDFSVTPTKLKNAYDNIKKGVGLNKKDGQHVMTCNYNHGAYEFNPEAAKNAGLASEFRIAGNRLQAKVIWTPTARGYIDNDEFLWISPEFVDNYVDENKKEHGFTVVAFALCNRPFLKKQQDRVAATDGVVQFVKHSPGNGGSKMLKEKLIEVLNLEDGKDDEKTLIETVKALTAKNAENEKALQDKDGKIEELGGKVEEKETENKELTEKVESLESTKTDAEKEVTALKERVEKTEKELKDNRINAFVEKAIEGRKIYPAEKEEFTELAEKDFELAQKMVAKRPEIKMGDTNGGPGHDGDVDDDPNEFLTNKARELADKDGIKFADAFEKVCAEYPEMAQKL
jgi:phage I-like protein